MHRYVLFCTLILLAGPSFNVAASPPGAQQVLQEADQARGSNTLGLRWQIDVENRQEGSTFARSYDVQAKGDNALAQCRAPARCRGETVLFNQRALWIFKTGMRKPVSLSARQRMSGQMASGDIAATHYARDYEATLVGQENVDAEPCLRLELKALTPEATYDAITYWVSQARHVGVQAHFKTASGKVFKKARFEHAHTVDISRKVVPFISRMHIEDATFPDNTTTIIYSPPKGLAIPDSAFNINNIVR